MAGCLSSRQSFTRWIEAPFASVRKASRVFLTLLDIQLPFALEDCLCFFLATSRTSEQRVEALAVASRRQDAEAGLKDYRRVGLDPVVLDQEGLALWTQALREAPAGQGDEALRVVIYLGDSRSSLAIGRGKRLLATHGLAGQDAEQIGRFLRAQMATGSGAEDAARVEWIWTGPAATDTPAVQSMEANLNRQWQGAGTIVPAPELFLARALATRALVKGPLRVNFRSGALAHEGLLVKSRRRAMLAASILLLAGLVLCAANAAVRVRARRFDDAMHEQVRAVVDRVAGYHVAAKGDDALGVAADEVDRRIEQLLPFATAFGRAPSGVLAEVMKAAGGLRIESLTLTRDKIQMNGTGTEWQSAEKLVTILGASGYDVKLTRRSALPDGTVPFQIVSEGDAK